MQDLDLEIRGAGGGGRAVIQTGGAQSPKKVFLAPRASVCSKNKTRGGRAPWARSLDPMLQLQTNKFQGFFKDKLQFLRTKIYFKIGILQPPLITLLDKTLAFTINFYLHTTFRNKTDWV